MKFTISRRSLVVVAALLPISGALRHVSAQDRKFSGAVSRTVWRPVRIGGGGYVTGIDISNDASTIVCRTDTYGGYIWNAATSKWEQLITSFSLAPFPLEDMGSGISELRVAPSDPTRLYMRYLGDVWKSVNRGQNWVKTNLNYATQDSSQNDAARFMGQKMAVDPTNPDVVYVGTPQDGVYVTFDGGLVWTQIDTAIIPGCMTQFGGAYPGHPGIVFDTTSGTTNGRTNTIYIPSYGNGVWQSLDAGANWSQLSNAPTKVRHAKIASDGIYYCANVDVSNANTLYKYASRSWSNISPGSRSIESVITDPSDATRVVAVCDNANLRLSANRGSSWGSLLSSVTRVSSDIPWLAWTQESFMSVGDMIFDPTGTGKVWFAEGIGVWTTTFSGSPSRTTWTSACQGIENLTVNEILCPPNGKPLAAGWDRSVIYIDDPEVYPSTHSPNNSKSIRMAWGIDYASSDPTFIAYASFWDGQNSPPLGSEPFGWYSTDGGQTWMGFSGFPSGGTLPLNPAGFNDKIGGCIACASPTNIIVVPSNDAYPWYTKDGGATWTEIVISGVPTSGVTGWGHAYYNRFRCVAADRVDVGTFYLYNSVTQGCYRSTDGGDSWTKMNSGKIDTLASPNAKLVAVPGRAGHLFLSGGYQGGTNPANSKLSRSTNGGATWNALANIKEPYCVGFGKAAPGQSYPTVFFVGWLGNIFGIYRSDDNCSTWAKIGDYPMGWLSRVKDIDGSKEVYGKVFVALGGAGYAYGVLH